MMDSLIDNTPPDWLEALDESEAELAAGMILPGDEVMRGLHASIARLEKALKREHRNPR